MDDSEVKTQSSTPRVSGNDALPKARARGSHAPSIVTPQACSSCGSRRVRTAAPHATPSYVYAIGRIEPRFPRPSVEKEFAQVTGRTETAGLTDRQALQRVLL